MILLSFSLFFFRKEEAKNNCARGVESVRKIPVPVFCTLILVKTAFKLHMSYSLSLKKLRYFFGAGAPRYSNWLLFGVYIYYMDIFGGC